MKEASQVSRRLSLCQRTACIINVKFREFVSDGLQFMTKKGSSALGAAALLLAATLLCLLTPAQAQAQTTGRARYDVTSYRIEAQLIPDQHLLRAGAEVTF